MFMPIKDAATIFREKLSKAVDQVDRPGSICASRDLPLTMPGLEVEGIGAIRLPLGEVQARKLIEHCSQAPYGKGTETLVDTQVRRVWELDPGQFKLTNPKWAQTVGSITSQVQQDLGLEKSPLEAHLYKLLIYEKGGFFLPHRDGEKLDRMVASLVIALPSPHTGGELIVSHEGRQHQIALGGAASGHEMSYAAFYADCEHEVRPVREGYRLCLAYNLTLARPGRAKGITAPRTGPIVDAVAALLRDWPSNGAMQKVAVALEHQYSQEGLKIDTLKGVDRARADILFDAAEQAGCAAHLALITHWQCGAAEGEDWDYSYRRGGRRRRSYHDDEDGTNEAAGHEMGEIYDQSLSVDSWSDRDGKKIAFGEMSLKEEEIACNQPREAWIPDREEFEGYTGNEGMTLERWYHRAALVIWPKKVHFAVLCEAGTDAAVLGLQSMVKQRKRARKSEQELLRRSCLEFAAAIIDQWKPPGFGYRLLPKEPRGNRSAFPLLLEELDCPELVGRFLTQVMPQDGSIQMGKSFPVFCGRHGWSAFAQPLVKLIGESTASTIVRNAGLLEKICLKRDRDVERISLGRRLAEHFVAMLVKLDNQPSKDWRVKEIDRPTLLGSLVKSLISVEAADPLAALMDHALARSDKYDLTDVHLAVLFALESWLTRTLSQPHAIINRWLAHCRAELEGRTAEAPTPPADFARNGKLSCTCRDCQELSRFLADPTEPVHRFPLAKERRRHLHQIIDSNHCDLTHLTARTGRPYALVCTKTIASYERAREIYLRDQKNLKRLRAIEENWNQANTKRKPILPKNPQNKSSSQTDRVPRPKEAV
jgi:2OG-Fe(II) oxygenase superfamily